jgi:hypothetical protein
MNRLWQVAVGTLVAWAVAGQWIAAAAARADESGSANRLFEIRTYITNDGKMPDLHKRFREHTNRLFEKHGMTLVAYWTPVDGPDAANTLVYVLAYPNREAREKSWKAFMADPDWQAAYKASHANGPLVKKVVSQFLTPTDYSPIK